jgi:hypothetical protein
MQRRSFLQLATLAGIFPLSVSAQTAAPVIDVYKSASCGCCTQWVDHLQKNGFVVNAHNVPNTAAYRMHHGIPAALGSCHTAAIGGYAIEGHVPARDIKRLLAEKPAAVGLAVPQMPMGAPGMEGSRSDAFDVLLIEKDGRRSVYRHYAAG